ncbi:hypothetical protein N2152v2_009625 [Parachlorella kessleri]
MVQMRSLQEALDAPRERRAAPSELGDAPADGLVASIFARHQKSPQPQSQQLCAILTAVLDVLRAEGLQATPTALYAALMSSLEKQETLQNSEVTAAMCHLLSLVLGRVPNAVLRAKLAPSAQLLAAVVEAKSSEAPIVKPALACLCQVLAAATAADWLAAAPAFNLLLGFCVDTRPKVRKAAQAGLVDVLAGAQAQQAVLSHASEAVVKVCQRVLPGPEAAARAAAAAPSKKRAQAEAAITKAVSDTLHLLEALKQTLFLLSGKAALLQHTGAPLEAVDCLMWTVAPGLERSCPSAASICELLLKLFPLRQPLLSRHASDALSALAASSASHLSPRALSELVAAVVQQEAAFDRKDLDLTLALTRFLETALTRLHELDAALSAARLPRAVHLLVPQLGAEQDTARFAASQCLRNLVNECIDEDMIAAALERGAGGGKAPAPLQSVVSAVEGSLGARYQDAWESCLPVVAELIERLGRPGAALAGGLVQRVGELCAGAEDADEEGAEAGEEGAGARDQVAVAAQNALGAAMRALGPEAVLAALPLNLIEGLEGTAEARTWLLPLLRLHVRGAHLGYWHQHLMPLARTLANRAGVAARDPARKREASICLALEGQVWATLPSFASWALDTAEAFRQHAKELAAVFERRPEVRPAILTALRRLCVQNKLALKAHGQQVGFPDPSNVRDDEACVEEEQAHLDIPDTYTQEVAQRNLKAVQALARNWLPLLLNAFLSTPPAARTQLEATISAYACVADAATLAQLFRAAITKLIKVTEQAQSGELGPDAVLEGGDTPTERRCTFMEASLALAGGLDDKALATLHKAARPGLQEKDPAVQKKAYKILAYICEHRGAYMEAHFQDVLETVVAGMATSVSAAKRYRLRCLKAVILALARPGSAPAVELGDDDSDAMSPEDKAKQVVASMVGEIILCVKESNKKTRLAAYQLLVEIGHALHEAQPPVLIDAADEDMGEGSTARVGGGGLHTLFTMVLGGLVGATPHMVSASVMALARLLFEFAPTLAGLVPELLPAVVMLLRSKAREVIKSVLGFVKVVVMRLPVDSLMPFIPQIMEGILLWCEDSKNKFRLKVRVILERLARRCGFEALEPHIPEAHRKLLTHIRKQTGRKERRKSEAGSQMDWEEAEETRSRTSRGAQTQAKTARTGDWDEGVFSDEEGEDAGTVASGKTAKTAGRQSAAPSRGGRRQPAGRLPASQSAEPVDLLDMDVSRKLARVAAGRAPASSREGGDDFERDGAGRMVIKEEKVKGGKRKRDDHGFDEDDSDFEDLKGFTGLSLALKGAKSVALAPSIAASLGNRSLGAKSAGAKTLGGKYLGARSAKSAGGRSARSEQQRGRERGMQHSGDRFRAKKKGTGGDVKGSSGVEPYAYWPLDRKMLNRRQQKSKGAQKGLEKIIAAAKDGAAKGRKAKRAKT